MTSDNEDWADRQIALMLTRGELIEIKDPENGESYYMPTRVLMDQADGLCGQLGTARKARHAKDSQPVGWRVRAAMVVISTGIVVAVTLPAMASVASRPAVHRLFDEPDEDEIGTVHSTIPMTVPAMSRVAVVRATTAAPQQAAAEKRSSIAQMFSPGSGRHRAPYSPGTRAKERKPYKGRGDVWQQGHVSQMSTGKHDLRWRMDNKHKETTGGSRALTRR